MNVIIRLQSHEAKCFISGREIDRGCILREVYFLRTPKLQARVCRMGFSLEYWRSNDSCFFIWHFIGVPQRCPCHSAAFLTGIIIPVKEAVFYSLPNFYTAEDLLSAWFMNFLRSRLISLECMTLFSFYSEFSWT